MRRHHLTPLVISGERFAGKQDNEDYAYEVMRNFFRSGGNCGGLFCVTDASAFGAAKAVRESGRTPGADFFIGGHDNLRFGAYANPPITTMEQPQDEICRTAWELLRRRMTGEHPRQLRYIHSSRLIVRKSG